MISTGSVLMSILISVGVVARSDKVRERKIGNLLPFLRIPVFHECHLSLALNLVPMTTFIAMKCSLSVIKRLSCSRANDMRIQPVVEYNRTEATVLQRVLPVRALGQNSAISKPLRRCRPSHFTKRFPSDSPAGAVLNRNGLLLVKL
eukprot:SAG31_NODE_15_length_37942_cov_32.078297_10_plen_147_part_00